MLLYIILYRLEKCISLVDHEKNKNNNLKITSTMELVPEFKENIENAKSQIEKLDVNCQRIKHIVVLIKIVNLKLFNSI